MAFGVALLVASAVWVWMMAKIGVFFGLLLGVPVVTVVFLVAFGIASMIKSEIDAPARLAEEERKKQEASALRARRAEIALQRDRWFSKMEGWSGQSQGRILNLPHRPKCVMAIGADKHLIRIVEYEDQEEFNIIADYTYTIRQIISLNTASPTVSKTVYTKQAVPIVSKKQRSPVARGLVGGMFLGPVGAMLGAASGLNGNISTQVEEHRVAQIVDGLGEPQLIMGLSDIERPVLKIQFEPSTLADEWCFKIRAAQSRR